MKRLFFIILGFVAKALFVALPATFIWLQTEGTPVSYLEREVLTQTVPPGGTLKVHIVAKFKKQCPADVNRWIVDGRGVEHTIVAKQRPGLEDYIVEVPVPLGAAPGKASYNAKVAWKCNFVQRWLPHELFQDAIVFTISPSAGQKMDPARQGLWTPPNDFAEFARAER